MAAHIGIPSMFGITLQADAKPLSTDRSRTIETSKVPSITGEYSLFRAKKTMKVDLTISGVGPAALASVTSASGVTASTLKLLKSQQGETVTGDGNPTFTNNYAGHEAFSDSGDVSIEAGAEPDIDTICEITSVTYSDCQTTSKSFEVSDKVITQANGTPGTRATILRKGDLSIDFAGDIPSGVALGSDGMQAAGMAGRLIVTRLQDTQKADDWNGGSAAAEICAVAA